MMGRAIKMGTIPPSGMILELDDNTITDCCRTSTAGYVEAISVNAVNTSTIEMLSTRKNRAANVSASMKYTVNGNANVNNGYIENNITDSISQEFTWNTSATLASLMIRHEGNMGTPESFMRRSIGSTWTDVGTDNVYKKT